MNSSQVIKAWGKILTGGYPSLSIEITRECPLRCPGCYAYEPEHLNGTPLRQLPDKKGEDLVKGVLELNSLLPILNARRIPVQLVTSAVREIPIEWNDLDLLEMVISIDGLQPE